jgi:hypothetical protein
MLALYQSTSDNTWAEVVGSQQPTRPYKWSTPDLHHFGIQNDLKSFYAGRDPGCAFGYYPSIEGWCSGVAKKNVFVNGSAMDA